MPAGRSACNSRNAATRFALRQQESRRLPSIVGACAALTASKAGAWAEIPIENLTGYEAEYHDHRRQACVQHRHFLRESKSSTVHD